MLNTYPFIPEQSSNGMRLQWHLWTSGHMPAIIVQEESLKRFFHTINMRHKGGDLQKIETLTADRHVVKYLLAMHDTEDVISECKAKIKKYRQSGQSSFVKYSEVLWETPLRCRHICEGARLRGNLTEALHKSGRALRTYFGAYEDATVQCLV